ncbi:MAG: tetratricopeptide repeat protein, partial [Magnetococcales bacterium]|nr:tetratricopeptide repeat protein [Magnetococcales bacterium]
SHWAGWASLFLVVAGGAFGAGLWLGRRGDNRIPGGPPPQDSTFYYRGLNFLLSDEPDRAIEEFIKAVRINSETVEIYLSLGNLYRARGEVGRAIRIHQNIIARPSLPSEIQSAALYALAEDYRQGGFVDRAVEAYRRVLEVDPDHHKALAGLQALHEQEGRWDNALTTLKRLEKVTGKADPRREAHLRLQVGKEFHRLGEMERAEDEFRAALKIFPGCVEANRLLGEMRLAQGDVKGAVKTLTAVLKNRPSHFFLVLELLRQAYETGGDAPGFEKAMAQAQENPSASTRASIRWGVMLQEQGRTEDAARVLRAGLGRDPGSSEAALRLLNLLADQGRWDEAARAAQHCLEHLTSRQHIFQCSHCGFRSRDIYWKCPQCHYWDTMEPL